jgi:hypothetical protein
MSLTFNPKDELELFCRFCSKIIPAQLDRSIAENGRVLDRSSTFEYYCTKCFKTACFSGTDLIEQTPSSVEEPRNYTPKESFFIGEKIYHLSFKELGTVVGKDLGNPKKILVKFEKSGLKKLIENL